MKLYYFDLEKRESGDTKYFSFAKDAEKYSCPVFGALKRENLIIVTEDGEGRLICDGKLITDFLNKTDEPIFSFVNTNYAHHMTYYLAERLRRLKGEEISILNIDAHADCSIEGATIA